VTPPADPFAERHGWKLLRAGAFAEALDALEAEVARLAVERPNDYVSHPKVKLLARIRDLILEEIPRDPNSHIYGLGNTMGVAHRHWRRAKFLQRFRLFFRFDSASHVIIYAWVNDENTLRRAGSRTDPYAVFMRRLDDGDPPDRWEDLLENARNAPQKSER
jgi:toxin YhaV